MKKFFFIFISLIVISLFSLWGYLQTTHAQKMILSFAHKAIQEKTGHQVEIEGISFPLPFHWIAYKVKVKENDHLWLTIDEIDISIPFWEIFNKTLALKHVSLVNVHIADLPQSKIYSPVENSDIDILNNLYNMKISDIQVSNFTINPLLLPHDLSTYVLPLDLEGSIIFKPHGRLVNIDFAVKHHANPSQAATHIHYASQGTNHFIFTLDILENKQGLISEVLNFALPYDLLLAVEGKKDSDNTYEGQFNLKLLDKIDVLPQDSRLSGDFFYSRNGQLNVHSKGLLGALSVVGEILVNTNDYKIHESVFNVDVSDCSEMKTLFTFPIEGLTGSIKARAAISGTLTNPLVDLKIAGDHLKIRDDPIENFSGEATFSKLSSGFEGHSLINLVYKQIRFKADSLFRWNDRQISLASIHADYGNAQIKGDLNYILENEVLEGKLEAFAEDGTLFQTLFDININSSTALSFKFYGAGSFENALPMQNLDFTIQAEKASYNNFHIEKAVLSGILRNVFKNPHADLILKAQHGHYKGWRLYELNAETSIDHAKNFWPFEISTKDALENDLSLKAKGRWQLTPEEFDVHVELLHGQIKKQPFKLQDPFTLFIQKDVFELSPLSLMIGKGFLHATLDYRLNQAHATTSVKNVPLEIFYPRKFIVPFSGALSGEASLFGTPGELTGQLQVQLSQIKILDEAFEHTPPFEAKLSGTIGSSHTACLAQIIGITEKPIEVKAKLPITASLNPPSIHIDELAPISAHVIAEGDVAPLLQLLVIETSSFSGKTSVALDITGSFHDPHVAGEIAVFNGIFESPNTGAVFHHLNARLRAQDKVLVLKEFQALDLSDGLIQGTGSLELNRAQGFPFTLNLQLSRIRLLNLDFAKAIASGDVVITGNSQRGKITGHLTTDSVQATIPDQAPALDHSLDIKYINLPKGEVSPIFTTSRPRWPLEFDVQIDVKKNATIKAKNLSSDWHGSVKVQGMAHAPQLFGDFKIIKGEYNFNGNTFEIKEGTISFAGEPDKKTTLYVIASKDLGKIVAEVILKGSVKNPLVAFRSNPPMPQREILSWILFGRGTTDITPFQGSELSQSISNLTKESDNKPDVLTKIRDSIGLDRIDISKTEGNESNDVSLQVGKYISRGVLVKINKSITSESNQIGIEANVLPNIKAEAQVGDDASTQIQLKWKRDY